MANDKVVVVLSCCKHSIIFNTKHLTLSEDQIITLGRATGFTCSSYDNGLFEYPAHLKTYILSRNHAELRYKHNEVSLRAVNPGTFINKTQATRNTWSKVTSGDVIILGGLQGGDAKSVVGQVSLFDPLSDDFKYFLKLENEYPFHCHWPVETPCINLSIEHLYSITKERLEVLKRLQDFGEDELNSPKNLQLVDDALNGTSYTKIFRQKKYHTSCFPLYEFRKNHHVSFFTLLVACCRNFRVRRWFIKQERKLFIAFWLKMFSHEQILFIEKWQFDFEQVPHSTVAQFAAEHPELFPPSPKYFKVHFTEVPNFLRRRITFILNGYCYISVENMYGVIAEKLATLIVDTCKQFHKNLHKIWYDERITSIIHFVEKNVGDYDRYKPVVDGERITEKNVHEVCDESFPLCMKILQYQLQRDHHLKNGGRFQYTLFLKGIGLGLANALCFWKSHFTRKMDVETFMKQYSYHVRHAYGAEGKMADYPPQNCADILKSIPGPLEYHGCPFKVLDEIRLKEALFRSGLTKVEYEPILERVRKGAPQEACKTYYEVTHGVEYREDAVSHPNMYYDESRKVRKSRRDHVQIRYEDPQDQRSKNTPSTAAQ